MANENGLVHLALPFSWPATVSRDRYANEGIGDWGLVTVGQMGHRHNTERPNLASHVTTSRGPGIVSLSVVSNYPVMLILFLLFVCFIQEGDQNCRSVIFLYLIKLKCIDQRINSP